MNNLTILNGFLILIFGFFSTNFSINENTAALATQNSLNTTTFTEETTESDISFTDDTDKRQIMMDKITEMYSRYTQYRTKSTSEYISQGWDKSNAVDNEELVKAADVINLREAKDLFNNYRLPTISKVGAENAHKFWLIVLNSNNDVDFQTQILKAMHHELEEDDISTVDYAFLADRIRINQGSAQIYGTQVQYNDITERFEPFDLKKPESVDQRRVIMGLERIQTYINEVNSKFNKPVKRKLEIRRSDRRRG